MNLVMEIFCFILVLKTLLVHSVIGIQFRLSQDYIDLRNLQNIFVNLTCSMTVTSLKAVTYIRIYMESNNGPSWEPIALIAGSNNAPLHPSLPNNVRSMMHVSGRLVNDPATSSQLVVSMNASLITYFNARRYRCELSYLMIDNFTPVEEAANVTFHVIASPSTPCIETVTNLNTNQVINVINSGSSALGIHQGEQLVCKANIGTDRSAKIQWNYASPSGTGMIDYNGYIVNGEALVDNSGGTEKNCRYTRSSALRYTITDKDAARDSADPLIFSCYVQSGDTQTQNNPMYTVTMIGTDPNQGTVNTIAIILSVLGVISMVTLVTVVIWFYVSNIRKKKVKRNSVPKESIPKKERDTELTSHQPCVDERNNYSNLYDSISDIYLECASTKEVVYDNEREFNITNEENGGSLNPVSDNIIVIKREHGYLSFKTRELETNGHEIQADNLETDLFHLNKKSASIFNTNSTDGYITPIYFPAQN